MREIRRAHERGERTAVQAARRDVLPKLARIIERAIDPQPERRYQRADALEVAVDVPLWTERFDRELKDVFAIQDEIEQDESRAHH